MPDYVNPYIPGQPVDNPDLFFGRREVLISIREQLVKGRRVFFIDGPARMGKSSLLRQVRHHLPDETLAVRIDLADEEAHNLDWLLWRVAEAVAAQLREQGLGQIPPTPWASFEGRTDTLLDSFWPRVRAELGERCLALLLDDIGFLAVEPEPLLDSFLTLLARWRENDAQIAIVLSASSGQQESLFRRHPHLLAGAVTFTLGSLQGEEATRLVTWPVDGRLTYDYGVARRVVEIASGQPYYLQLLCFEIFSRCAPAGWVSLRDVDLVVEELVAREIGEFRQVWDQSSAPEQAVLAALVSLRGARGVATVQEVRTVLSKAGARPDRGHVSNALETLAARGILERLGALTYRFRVGLLRDWLMERIDLHEVVRKTRWDANHARRAGEKQVVPLAPSRQRPRIEEATEEETAPVGPEARRRLWLWLVPVSITGLVLLALLGATLLRPGSPTPTPTSRPLPSPTLVAATLVPAGTISTRAPATALPPRATDTPLPSDTPSPTPPIVLARTLPAIAYQSRGPGEAAWSIYVMDNDGSHRVLVTAGQSGFLAPPSWSPEGTRLAFISDQGGTSDAWVSGLDGQNPVNLTNDEAKDHSPAWSPNGQWIAFASLRDALYWELYVMGTDGSEVQRLTWWEDASDLAPSWSPDSSRIAFATKRDGNWEIYTMDRDGSNLVRITNHPADDTNPAWSPDGSRIAFESTRDGYAEVFVVAVAGGEPVNVSNAPLSSEHGPTWSPDGGRLAFYSDQDGEWDIYVVASDGSNLVKLTGENSNDQVPAWRP